MIFYKNKGLILCNLLTNFGQLRRCQQCSLIYRFFKILLHDILIFNRCLFNNTLIEFYNPITKIDREKIRILTFISSSSWNLRCYLFFLMMNPQSGLAKLLKYLQKKLLIPVLALFRLEEDPWESPPRSEIVHRHYFAEFMKGLISVERHLNSYLI